MTVLNENTKNFIEAVASQTSKFISEETGVEVLSIDYQLDNVRQLELSQLTSIMTVEGHFQFLFAFSFDKSLVCESAKVYTAELTLGDETYMDYIQEMAADIINIVLGNVLVNFEIAGKAIELTPPVVITDKKIIYRKKQAQFLTAEIKTLFGRMQICCVGPKDLFDNSLNYVS